LFSLHAVKSWFWGRIKTANLPGALFQRVGRRGFYFTENQTGLDARHFKYTIKQRRIMKKRTFSLYSEGDCAWSQPALV
jgi:hypothetical protein